MASVVRGNLEAFVRPNYLILYNLNTYALVKNGKEMHYLNAAFIFQAFFFEGIIDFFPQGSIFLHQMVCLFQTAVATLAECHYVQVHLFSQGEIPCRGQNRRLKVDVSHGISTAIKFAYIHQFETQLL